MNKLSVLEKSKAIQILLTLLEKDNLSISELLHLIGSGSNTTILRRLQELESAGLIETSIITIWPIKKRIKLTKKGKKVAKILKRLAEILEK